MSFTKLLEEKSALAAALDLLGDKWTLLILSGCLARVRRFNEFEKMLGINRNLLASRLDKLVDAGVLEKRLYNEKPMRYEYLLSNAGLDLRPIISGLIIWSEQHLVNGQAPVSVVHKGCGSEVRVQIECLACKKPIPNNEITSKLNPNAGELSTAFHRQSRPAK